MTWPVTLHLPHDGLPAAGHAVEAWTAPDSDAPFRLREAIVNWSEYLTRYCGMKIVDGEITEGAERDGQTVTLLTAKLAPNEEKA